MNIADPIDPRPISNEAIRSEVEKICSSVTLASATRLCRFLKYVVERTLAGHGEELKEYSIGIEVFDRAASYDPNIDSIVRSGARRLRSKLKEYFESEGVRDSILINLRAGSYVPLFRLRQNVSIDIATKPVSLQSDELSLLIAVLPFATPGDDLETEAFAQGLIEEISHRFSLIAGLGLVARRSASQFKGTNDLSKIRETLGADLVLDGTVRKDGSQLRISIELANTSDGHQLWSERVHCEMTDVFRIQDEIATSIIAAIRPRTSQFREFALKSPQIVLAAYSLYLRGRQLWNQQTSASLSAAIGCFEEAIRKAPTYAPAHAGLADCYLALAYQGAETPREIIPRAKSAALRAIELDDHMTEAITSLANIRLHYDWDWQGAEGLYQRAIQFGGDSTAHLQYGVLLDATGRFDEALEHHKLAMRLDPRAAQPRIAMGLSLFRHMQGELAIEHLHRALELPGNSGDVYCWLSLIYILQHKPDQAIDCIQKARAFAGANPSLLPCIGAIYALAGRRAEAQLVMNEVVRMARTTYVSPVDRSLLYLALGEKNAALDLLQQGFDERASGMIWLKADPRFDPVRGDARFVELLEKMEFPRTSR